MQGLLKGVIVQLNLSNSSKKSDSFENNVFDNNEFLQLKSNDVEYFDSVIEEERSIIIIKRYIFYKNVYVFVNRLKDVATNKDNEKIRKTLSTCFRNKVFI